MANGEKRKAYSGPAILDGGFRVFFLAGAIYAALMVGLWVPVYMGAHEIQTTLTGVDWHIHELMFGYVGAVLSGFLFTAIPNWTGRFPLRGMPLLALACVWVAGRLAMNFSVVTGWQAAMVLDCSFLTLILLVAGIEICKGKNWRNLKVLIPVGVLLGANIGFHLEAHVEGVSEYSRRVSFLAVLALIMLIGGRIIPSFTRNWLNQNHPGQLPVPFNRFDAVAIVTAVAALAIWSIWPDAKTSGALLGLAAVMHTIRLVRWAGYRAAGEVLIFMLHIAYLFVPLGYGLLAWSILQPGALDQQAGLHALAIGAIGGMTITVMTRAALGHTGRTLAANTGLKLVFALIVLSALIRVAAGVELIEQELGYSVSATCWVLAFTGFVVLMAPALIQRRA